ncbi:MAG: MarR family transcriptional regulator [Bacillota bacterium]
MHEEHVLATRLRACGHFLYYQTGGKAGQRRILVTILKRESLTQKELQDMLEISSGALSEILQKMEEASLVERKKSCDDKRQVTLALTPAGKCMALQVQAHYARTLERMFECLSGQEKAQLGGILEKLVEHLDALKTDPLFEAGAADDARRESSR